MAQSRSSRLPVAAKYVSRNMHWFAFGGGITVTALCTGFLLGAPFGQSLEFSAEGGKGGFPRSLIVQADGKALVLTGIGGETFAPGAVATASEDIVLSNDQHELALAALEDGADRRCLTITAANGQTLSFRILGIRPVKGGAAPQPERVELAIAACARNGDSVAKVVMEPEAGQPPKAPAPERSL